MFNIPRILFVVFILGLFTSLALSQQNEIIEANSELVDINDYDIYCAGRFGTGNFSEDNACYWMNGVRYDLQPSSSRASAIYVVGDDIYVLGIYQKDSKTRPCYWKNGNLVDLQAPAGNTYASDIFVSGKDIFVSGHSKTYELTLPCYWKNGEKMTLEVDSNTSYYTKSIFVKDENVYIAGFNDNVADNKFQIRACYWMNGKKIELESDPNLFSVATDIFVSENEVYIAGRLDDANSETLCYWKDGNRIELSNIQNKYRIKGGQFLVSWENAEYHHFTYEDGLTKHKIGINSMYVSNGNVYIIGKFDKSASYWVNKEMKEIEMDGNVATARHITVIDTNVLIVGRSNNYICLWENEVKSEIFKIKDDESPNYFWVEKK
ncbi:hypothetical protein ACFLSS_00810 [Bacteroidota bacterium]